MSTFQTRILVSFACIVTTANANYIVLNCTNAGPVTVTAAAPNAAQTLSCPQFNSALGPLTSYSFFTFNGGVGLPQSGSVTLSNTGSSSSAFPIVFGGGGGTSTAVIIMMNVLSFPGQPGALPSITGPASYGSSFGPFLPPVTIGPGNSFTYQAAAFFPAYLGFFNSTSFLSSLVGGGVFQVPITFHSFAGDLASSGSSLVATDWSLVLDSAPFLNVVYDYSIAPNSSIPEPSTYALMVTGLSLLAARFRRSNDGRRPERQSVDENGCR